MPIRVRLSLGAKHHGMVTSHNVIADLPGREVPEEVILVGCHLDSWDVGQGAQDDGAGCMIAWEAARLVQDLGLSPRRTIRVVFFTSEENGIWGGKAYAEERLGERRHIAALESDTGNGRAVSLGLDLSGFADSAAQYAIEARVEEMERVLNGAGLQGIERGYSGADIGPSVRKGVVGFGMHHNTETYWPIHHTTADTFDKIVPADLAHNVGVMAAAVYYLAQVEDPLVPETTRRRLRGKD